MIFQDTHTADIFTNDWKKGKAVPIYKKNDKLPFSLLPTCSNIFEKITFHELFAFFGKRNVLRKHQFDFCLGASFIYELLAITHNIFLSFDSSNSMETFREFLDISKLSIGYGIMTCSLNLNTMVLVVI